jgi:branched-chain amino acid aminotransferase
VITIARDIGIPVVHRDLLREELFLADEAFLTGTAAEVTPIREVNGRIIGKGGKVELTTRIQSKFFEVVHGKDQKYQRWLHMV